MVDPKRKKPMRRPEPPAKNQSARNMFQLYIRYKAEMNRENWDALLLDVPKEVMKWFAFADANQHDTGRTLVWAKGLISSPPKRRARKKSKTFSPRRFCGSPMAARGQGRPQPATKGRESDSSSGPPTTVMKKIGSRGHPRDPSANRPRGD